jgi:hypothetical protein
MDGSQKSEFGRRRGASRHYAQFAPVVWIAVLLACWLVIVEWKMLPELVSATMAALP